GMPSPSGGPVTLTGQDGRFKIFTNLTPRCWIVTGSSIPAWAVVEHDTPDGELILKVPASEVSISGRVVDVDGHPLGGQRVIVRRESDSPRIEIRGMKYSWSEESLESLERMAWTDENGRFRVLGLPSGPAQLVVDMAFDRAWSEASHRLLPVESDAHAVDDSTVNVMLPSSPIDVTGLWSCRLQAQADDVPARNAQLLVEVRAGGLDPVGGRVAQESVRLQTITLDGEGRALLYGRRPQTQRAELRAEGYPPRLLWLSELTPSSKGIATVQLRD
ncbi:MAG: carboxypeptidase-like regulatory domain-containing protein, partial [Planctomycetota bacterium]